MNLMATYKNRTPKDKQMPPFVESFLMNDWLSVMLCMSKHHWVSIVVTHSPLKTAYGVP
jgi:hypothetical protein